jgi:FdhD protein
MNKAVNVINITRYQGTNCSRIEDYIAVEKKLKLSANRKNLLNLYCTPSMIKELVAGLLYTGGFGINKISPEKIRIAAGKEIRVNLNTAGTILKEGLTISRCLGGVIFHKKRTFRKIKDDFLISAKTFKTLFSEFRQRTELFRLTGCFHSAALSDGVSILAFAEDIGRHNAVDKVVGYCILNGIPFEKKLLLVSCRLSSEIVSKCSACRIPVLVSRSAPTDLAIDIAEQTGITLIGFAREDRMNVYTNPQRII